MDAVIRVEKYLHATILVRDLERTRTFYTTVLGLEEIAYVKPIVEHDEPAYAIHAADGTRLAVLADRLAAFAMIRCHDLEAASLH